MTSLRNRSNLSRARSSLGKSYRQTCLWTWTTNQPKLPSTHIYLSQDSRSIHHSFLFVPFYRYIPFGSNAGKVRAFTQISEICLSTSTSQDRSRHGRRLVPLTRTRRLFFFFFFSKIFPPLSYCFLLETFYILTPFLRSSILPASIFFLKSGVIFSQGSLSPSAPVTTLTTYFLFSSSFPLAIYLVLLLLASSV